MDTPAAFDPADLGTPLNSAPTLTNFAQTRYNMLAQRPVRTSTKLPYMTYEQIASDQDVYDPTDFKTVGERIRENVKQAVLSRFPLSNDQYTLRIENLAYEKPKRQHLRDEKEAILNNASLGDRLRGDWVLIDNATGKELQRKTATLMNVPRMTERGTFIRNGSELALKHMFRLRPGVYARIKDNGIIAAHINPAQTTGRQMSMELDPETGVLYMTRGTRMYGVLPMLRAAGVSEDAIRTAWGDELYQMNLSKYDRLMDESAENKKAVTTMTEYRNLWNNEISKTLLDPETTKSTLGVAYDRITPDTLLQTSKKILKIAREADTLDLDDRDGLQFQKVLGPADYIAERIVRDGGGVLRTLFNRISRKGTLDDVEPGEFQPHIDSVFMEGKHAGYIEGSSPMESLDFNTGVSRLGEGGIGDTRAAPAESRGVQDSFAGFIDPIRCFAVGHTVLIREPDGVERWKPLEIVTMDDLVGCWIDDVLQFRKPLEIHKYPYDGELILFDNGTSACFVTPNHRMHVIYASEMDRGLLDLATEIGTDDQGIVSHFVVRADELLNSKTVALASLTVDNTLTASLFHQSEIQRVPYNGFVYCLSVPGERLFVKYQESSNILSMNSPESLKVGLDVYLTHGALKDSKGNLYTRMRMKDGSVNYVDMTTAANAIVATPEFYDPKADPSERIPAFFHGKGIEYVPRKDVDFYLASSNNMMSTGTGMIPLIGGIRSNRTLMGCLHPDTLLCIYRNNERLHIYAKEYLTQLKAGDMVLSLDAQMNPCFRPVRQVLTVHQDLDVYEVKTTTGKTVVVNGTHKWLTFTNKNDHCELLTTTDLRKDMFIPVEDYRMRKYDRCYSRHAIRAPYTADMYQACLTKFGGRSTELKRIRAGSISSDFFKTNGIPVSPILDHTEWERIVSVTPVGTAEYLVDLDVDDNVYMLANGVFTHNSKYPIQALPLKHRQAPGVQRLLTLPDGTQTTTERYVGKYLGAKFAPVNGTILSVEPDSIVMRGTDGKKYEIDLYHNFPANQKGYITNHPVVQPGQKVKANEILAPSNYTDENGVAALGTNLRVAFRNGRNAGTFEDAIRISDEAAELLGSEQMYKTRGDVTPDIEYGKQKYLSLFRSNEFTREQLDQLGDDGVVKVGTVLKKGDPIMMGVQHKDQSTRGIARNAATPYLSVWEHDYPGTVMDVARGRKHLTVYTQAYTPMQVGDKMCYDEETQIFTDRGWLYFKDLRGDDRVLTLNPQSGESYLINFVRAYQYAYKGKMYSLQTPDLDILVTPNHRHLVARNCDCTYMRLMFSTEIFGKCVYHLTNVRVEDENSYKCSKVEGAVEEWVDYDGMIYCVEVPYTHTVFVRRNGKTVWSGNSSRYGSKGTVSCYDEDTTVFTDQGFKPFSQLRVEDKVAVLDPVSNTFQFEHPSAIHSGPYKGLMYGYRDRNLDWLVTPTHDMWCKRAHRNHKGDTTYQEFGRVNVQTVQGYAWLHPVAAPHRDLAHQTARAKELLDTIRRDPVTEVRSVAEARQRACIRYGLHAIIEQEQQYSRTLFRLRVSDCRTAQSKQRAREDGYYTKEYDGFVYCCTVSTGILLVARNGKPMWCGNSIVPKEEMLRDSQGRPVHIELSPLGTTSRLNTALLADANLGKIAEKTGKPVILPDFLTDDTIPDFVEKELKKHGLTESEDLFDPVSGKTVKDVATGIVFHYKLKHMSESKQGARSTGEYTAEDLPMKGGKTGARRLGNMEVSALAAHGADQVLRDAKLIRGQRNDEFWRSFRDGMTPTPPSSPLVNQKFFAHLRAAGISLEEYPDRVHMYGATDQDIKKLTGQRRVSFANTFANTFDSKHLQPVPGGLFDPAIFGADGEQWGYYELPEPVLNPMMFKATANALGWKDKELEGVLKGERQINGKVGIDGLRDALEHLDIDKELRLAKQTLRAPRVPLSKRDQARKKIRALQPMADAGVEPTDFLLTRIPILPPRYRPVSKMANDVNIAADVNFLYKRMIDAAEDLKEAKSVLPEEAQMDARTSLYQALEAVTGLSETDDPKLQAKNVAGVLKWAFGKGSPKLSAAHRKLFGVAVDLGGRGVVVPDNSLTIDEVGLPEETAWKMFEPFVLRKLRQRGYRMLDALRYTTDRTPEARKLLEESMAERPILVNRAPTLWRYGIMGFFPKLRGKPGERNTIFTNPNIAKPFGLDHDGDSIWNLVRIACKLDNLKQIFKENGSGPLIFSENSVSCMSETTTTGITMLKEGSQIYDVNHITVAIEDIPIIPESHRVDDNGNEEWDVPEGFFVYTMEREKGACGLAPITKKSLHKNIQMFDVTTAVSGAYTQVITCSADKSLVAYADDGTLALMTPAEVKGHPIPYLVATDTGNAPGFCAKYIKIGTQQSLSFDLGVFIGAMLGDGWVDSQDGAWIAAEHPDIQNALIDLLRNKLSIVQTEAGARLYEYDSHDRFGGAVAHRINCGIPRSVGRELRDLIGAGAINKRIPVACMHGSRAHLLGLLVGLLATDGCIHCGTKAPKGKKTVAKSIVLHTTSPLLRDGIQQICKQLGVRTTASPYKGVNSVHTCYAIALSITDTARLYRKEPKFRMLDSVDQASLEKIVESLENSDAPDKYDLVPFPRQLRSEFTYAGIGGQGRKYHIVRASEITTYDQRGSMPRTIALQMVETLRNVDWTQYTQNLYIAKEKRTYHTPEQAAALVAAWCDIVENTEISWRNVVDVQPAGVMDAWDLTVPGPYTFALSDGTIVQDTMNLHTPVSKQAVQNVIQKMLPSRNLLSPKNMKAHYLPQAEFLQGLYLGTRSRPDQKPVRFRSAPEMLKALRRGEITYDTPVEIID
jgi:DNA-directed RNA polymerase beta subunit/DNA-directed RNA polymerase beta' subunit